MLRWIVGLGLAATVLIAGSLALHAQPRPGEEPKKDKERRTINTSGTATIRVKPDHARVYFGVQTMAATVKEARAENANRVKKVLEALAALKIPDLKMKTTDVSVELVQAHHQQDKLPQILGYKITNAFTVLIKDQDVDKLNANASKVLDVALEAGANFVQQIQFFKQEVNDVRREALARAVQEAMGNARALAQGGNVGNFELIGINGEPTYAFYGNRQMMMNSAQPGSGEGADTTIVAGELEITCNVSITCAY